MKLLNERQPLIAGRPEPNGRPEAALLNFVKGGKPENLVGELGDGSPDMLEPPIGRGDDQDTELGLLEQFIAGTGKRHLPEHGIGNKDAAEHAGPDQRDESAVCTANCAETHNYLCLLAVDYAHGAQLTEQLPVAMLDNQANAPIPIHGVPRWWQCA